MEPINYNIDVKSPIENAVTGLQTGLNVRNAINQQRQLELQQKQQLQMQADLASLSAKAANGTATAQDYASAMARNPQLAEHLKKSWDTFDAGKQQTTLSDVTQAYAALHSDNPEIATNLLNEKAQAYRNAGDEAQAKKLETFAKTIEINPAAGKTSAALMLSAIMGPEKFAETFSKLGQEQRAVEQAPADLRTKNANAVTAEIKAKYADSDAIMDLQKKGWDITKIQEDIKIAKEANRIAAMKAAADREGNALKRQELQLKITETKQKMEDKVRETAATVESARSGIDNFLNTADRIVNTPLNVVKAATGPLSSKILTTSQDTADFEALVETLSSQAFISQIPNMKGTGSLSEKEGDKLQASLQNLSLKQSDKQLIENVKEAQRLLMKARKNLTLKYGVPESIPDTPAAKPQQGKSTDDILRELGVM